MAQRKRKVVVVTLLVVGEGADDKAFIKHIKSLFHSRSRDSKGPKIEAGDGGSADVIITNTLRTFKDTAYNTKLLVLDADLPPSPAKIRAAKENGFHIILWAPQCLEGALLDVLGEPVNTHETSQNLKKRLHPQLPRHHTQPEAYATLFTKPVLETTSNQSVIEVRNIIAQS